MREPVYIGADGGGSRTTVTAVDASGNVLGSHTGGGINFYSEGMERARNTLKETVDGLKKKIGLEEEAYLSIGMSALDDYATEEQLISFCGDCFDPKTTFMCSDIVAGLYGLTLGEPGVMLISGTGMIAAALDQNKNVLISGGLGYLLNDEGGCYGIGHAGILSAIRALEKVGPSTILSEKLLSFYGISYYRDLIPILYEKENVNGYIASFALMVLEASREGDLEAIRIVDQNLSVLVAHANRLLNEIQFDTAQIGVYGGLFEKNPDIRERFQQQITQTHAGVRVQIPSIPPQIGAVLYALYQTQPPFWKEAAYRLKKQYE